MIIQFLLVQLILLLLAVLASSTRCPDQCRFGICNIGSKLRVSASRRIRLRAAGITPLGPVICQRKLTDSIGYILTTGEPTIFPKNSPEVLLKDWAPPGLSTRFQSKFIGVGDVPVYAKSSFTRKEFSGNQIQFLNDLCIKVPVISYQKRQRKTGKTVTVQTKGRAKDCVTFRPLVDALLVELEWNGRDDLDLFLEEPSGLTVSKFNGRSMNGRFVRDTNTGQCFSRKKKSGRELVVYQPMADKGKYTMTARHFQNCADGPTEWWMRATSMGKLVLNVSGTSNKTFSEVIKEFSFSLPNSVSI